MATVRKQYTSEFGRQAVRLVTERGWLCLAVVLDLKSRRVVGWGLSRTLATLEQTVAHQALEMALRQRPRHDLDASLLFRGGWGKPKSVLKTHEAQALVASTWAFQMDPVRVCGAGLSGGFA